MADLLTDLDRVLQEIAERHTLTEQSERRALQTARTMGTFFVAHGIRDLNVVTVGVAEEFVRLPIGRESPSAATMHFRRSMVRLLFATARRLGLAHVDPTIDMSLPQRGSTHLRPLDDDEIAVCRSSAVSLGTTRHAATFALAEATVRTAELALVRKSHLDLDDNRVWIVGGSKTDARWGYLTPWGREQLAKRMNRLPLPADGDPYLVSRGGVSAESRQASSCIALSQIFAVSGLDGERDVRPASVAAWAGASAFAKGLSIEGVSRLLGVRSLDQAARLIGWDWSGAAT